MRIAILQHVAFEGPGAIAPLLRAAGHQLTTVRLDQGGRLPPLADCDGLVVLGGPMGVADTDRYLWLPAEKKLLKAAIADGKRLLGICLGAQLLAEALGARVTRNDWREIGWFPVTRTAEATASALGARLPAQLEVFHWHGDTFSLPAGATRLASSAACSEQAFVFGEQVLGLQFHLEMTPETTRTLLQHGHAELDGSRYVQTAEAMLHDAGRYQPCHAVLTPLLQQLFKD